MSWTEEALLFQEHEVGCDDTYGCFKFGEIGILSNIKREDTINVGNEPISVWGMSQETYHRPAIDNDWVNEPTSVDNITNKKTKLVQNWSRSDLSNLNNYSRAPAATNTTDYSGSISVSVPFGASISATASSPRIEILPDFDNQHVAIDYDYDNYWGQLAAADENTQHRHVTSWISDRPSSGDKIAPSYYWGQFEGQYNTYPYESTTSAGNTFYFFRDGGFVDA